MRRLLVGGLVLLCATPAAAQCDSVRMTLSPAAELEWKDGPASLPKGAKMVILEGDPSQPGVFTLRIKFPAGFKVLPHHHSQFEHATVISGRFSPGPSPA